MNALEMALEALTNPSTIVVHQAIHMIKEELSKGKPPPWYKYVSDAQLLDEMKFRKLMKLHEELK